jgi:hypothetical protein
MQKISTLCERSDLLRIRRVQARQVTYRWGPKYQAAIRAVRGEVPALSGSGTLPAQKLCRELNALSWPEKVAGALALYHPNSFEVHDQHVYYPSPMEHPLAHHRMYSHLPWPSTTGTFAIAEKMGLQKWHPKAWDKNATVSSCDGLEAEIEKGEWEIGAWIGDFLLNP